MSIKNPNSVYVKTPHGRRYHGRIVINDKGDCFFERKIDGRYVRWSDRTFCLNTSAIPKLKKSKVKKIIIFYRKKDITEGYRINFEDVLSIEPTINEKGESNIRIPIDDCELVKVWKNEELEITPG